MASPLLPYANAKVLVTAEGTVSIVNGRLQASAGQKYYLNCYMKRAQYSGVSSGSKKLPLESQLDGEMLPGASGDSFYYRGYALQTAPVPAEFQIGDDDSGLTWNDVQAQEAYLLPGTVVEFKLGTQGSMSGRIERSNGVFGGQGIDEIIYRGIGGVELQITGSEVQL